MNLPIHSIRWKVQIGHAVALLAAIAALCASTWQLVWMDHVRRIDRELQDSERVFIKSLMHAAGREHPPTEASEKQHHPPLPESVMQALRDGKLALDEATLERFSDTGPGCSYFALADSEGQILLSSGYSSLDPAFPPLDHPELEEELRFRGDTRESLHHSDFGLWSVVGRDIRPEREEMRRLGLGLAGVGLGLWFMGLLGGWWMAGRAIKPIKSISHTATRIAQGNLEERVPVSGGRSELDQLASVLNGTFGRLHDALERQRRFTADAGHELRTPLTVILTETQRVLKRERSAEEYRETLVTCREAGLRMRSLVEGLLLLARKDDGRITVQPRLCDLALELPPLMQQLLPLAARAVVHIERDLQPVEVRVDPQALSTIVSNLVGNAIHHRDTPGGFVRVTCGRDGDTAWISVDDDGPGISPVHLERIFERFYRADEARSGADGHSGLGLSIVQALVEAHSGRVEVESRVGEGSCFKVILPLQQESKS